MFAKRDVGALGPAVSHAASLSHLLVPGSMNGWRKRKLSD